MQTITSAKNGVVRELRALGDRSGREAAGRILVEGEVMIREALNCGLAIHDALAVSRCAEFARTLEAAGARVYEVPDRILDAVCPTRTPQGVCASFTPPEPAQLSALPDRVVALDGVQDPGNVGTIWRTADAAGFQAILFGPGCADAMSPKVLRAAMGSGFRLPYARTDDLPGALDALRAKGYALIASDLRGEDFYRRADPGSRYALVIGSEAHGISPEVRALATMRVRLPMRGGAESLNAAVAAGILMYDLTRDVL